MNATPGSTPGPDARAERSSTRPWQRRLAPTCGALALLPAAAMLFATGAQAQADPCDTLKSTLAARIEATGVRGYSLEAVPGNTPVPSDAKVIGTCKGGAVKMLYRRWARASTAVAEEAKPAPAPVPAPAPSPAPGPVAKPAPAPMPQPVVRVEEPAPAVAAAVPVTVDAAVGRASEAEAVPVVDRAVAPPAQAPLEAKEPLTQQASGFMAENWRWMLALLLLPLAGWLWAWRAHRNAYDEAGLPRGPKL